MKVERYAEIEQVLEWPGSARHGVFQTRGWTRSVEGALGDLRSYLVCKEDDGSLRGSATCYFVSPEINPFLNPSALVNRFLDDGQPTGFLTPSEREEAALVGSRIAHLFDTSVVSTAPFGFTHSVSAADGSGALEALVAALGNTQHEWDARCSAVLYVEEHDRELRSVLRNEGYAQFLVGANCVLPIVWKSFEEYLGIFNRKRRLSIERERRQFTEGGISVSVEPVEPNLDEIAHLQALLQQKYGAGYHPENERRVFVSLMENIPEYAHLLVARRDGELVAFAMFLEKDGIMHSKMAARDSRRTPPEEFAYFNIVYYELIEEAIRRGVREIHYGPEAYAAKLRRGCEPRPLYWYVKGPDSAYEDLARLARLVSDATSRDLEHFYRP